MSYDIALADDVDMRRQILSYFLYKQRVVSASQYDSIYIGGLVHKQIDVFFDEIVSTCGVVFAIFYKRHPHRAGLLENLDFVP